MNIFGFFSNIWVSICTTWFHRKDLWPNFQSLEPKWVFFQQLKDMLNFASSCFLNIFQLMKYFSKWNCVFKNEIKFLFIQLLLLAITNNLTFYGWPFNKNSIVFQECGVQVFWISLLCKPFLDFLSSKWIKRN